MKKILPILIMSIMLASCASKSDSTKTSYDSYGAAYEDNAVEYAETAAAVDRSDSYAEKGSDYEASPTSNTAEGKAVNKKIIKNANVDMTAKDVNECYDKIIAYISDKNGYEYNKNMSTSGDYVTINAELKVNPNDLDDVLAYIDECGDVINSNTSSDDITTQYIDTQIRLENKKKNLDKYYDYYDKAENMEEALILQDKIDQITAEIESYEGQLNYWNTQVSESTITLYIQQENDPIEIERDVEWNALSFKDMGNLIYNGFTKVSNAIVSVFQWIIIFLISILPLVILAGVVVFIIVFSKKHKRNKKNSVKNIDCPANAENNIDNNEQK